MPCIGSEGRLQAPNLSASGAAIRSGSTAERRLVENYENLVNKRVLDATAPACGLGRLWALAAGESREARSLPRPRPARTERRS